MRGGVDQLSAHSRTGSGSNAKLKETTVVLAVWLARAGRRLVKFRRAAILEQGCLLVLP
jgi:hypothetical protein